MYVFVEKDRFDKLIQEFVPAGYEIASMEYMEHKNNVTGELRNKGVAIFLEPLADAPMEWSKVQLHNEPAPNVFARRQTIYRHRKTGIEYTLIHYARDEFSQNDLAVYKAQGGQVWVRPWSEFLDRFEFVRSEEPA